MKRSNKVRTFLYNLAFILLIVYFISLVTNRHDMSSRGSSLAHGDATALHRYLSAQKSMSHTSPSRVLRDGSLRSNLGRPSVGESGSTGLNRFLSLHRDRRNPSELSDLQAGRVGSLHAPMQSSGIESVLRRPMHVDDDDDVSVYQRALVGELTGIQVAKFVTFQLNKVAAATKEICLSLDCMREGCHPFIFYHRVRPFLSGWKDNPILPKGVVYQGVSEEPKQFFGGSAAQSSLIPFLDIGLGLSHTSTKSHDFLSKMREYMPRSHRQFLEYLQTVSCIRSFVQELMPSDHILDVEGKFKVSDPPTTPSAAISVTKPIDTMNQISQPKSPVASSPKATDITSVDDDNNTNSNINNNSSGNSSLRRSRNPHRSSLSAIRASMGIDTSTIKNKVEDDAVAALTRGDSEMIDNDRGELLFSPSQLVLTNLDAKYPSKSDAITKTSISDPQHQHDQEYISKKQLAKRLVDENVWLELRDTYNDCVSNLQRFRSGHINLVAEYIIAQQKNGVVKGALESSAGGKGTGGTDLMKFLKPIRDNCENSLIRTVPAGSEQGPSQLVAESTLDLSRVSEEDEMSVRSAILSRAHSRATTSKLPDVSTTAVEKAIGWRHDDEKLFATPYVKDSAAGDDIDIFHGTNSDFSSNNFIAAVSATAGEPAGISQANDTNESNKSTYLSPPPMSEVSQKDSRSYSDRSLGELWRPS